VKNIVDETVTAIDDGALPAWISKHVRTYIATDGRDGHMWDASAVGGKGAVSCLLLTTRGRRSGKSFVHPLVYGEDAGTYIVVASKGGADTQPQWYFNLLAGPDVEVQVAAKRFTARATLANGAERERLWSLITQVYPPYDDYQAKTTRQIPIFTLTPTSNS